jgi:hypothetical protein
MLAFQKLREEQGFKTKSKYSTSLGRTWGDECVWQAERYAKEAKQKLNEIRANGNINALSCRISPNSESISVLVFSNR